MINESIFRSYDIRGIYPSEVNEHAAYNIARGYIKHTGAKKVVLGYDTRLSGPALFKAFAAGMVKEGAYVFDMGKIPTEGMYFAASFYDVDAGVIITASHNPKEYNGFKMMKRDGKNIVMVRGRDLVGVVQEEEYVDPAELSLETLNIWPDYINYLAKFLGQIRPLKIVVDASNGVGGKALDLLKGKIPLNIITLNFEPDGNFPNHSPNPVEPGSSDQIKEVIQIEKADFGFMFDSDADRLFLIDEQGVIIPSDITLLLLAKYFLKKEPGATIAYNAICSHAVPEFVQKWGGNPIRTMVGFVNVREEMMKHGGVMGGELSGHYCFRDYFYTDSGIIALLILAQIISEDGRKVSEIVNELTIYFKTDANFEVKDKDGVLIKVKENYSDGKQDFLDGVTVEYQDWWFNVRPSNTEPLLRLTIEANTRELLEQKKKELSNFILESK